MPTRPWLSAGRGIGGVVWGGWGVGVRGGGGGVLGDGVREFCRGQEGVAGIVVSEGSGAQGEGFSEARDSWGELSRLEVGHAEFEKELGVVFAALQCLEVLRDRFLGALELHQDAREFDGGLSVMRVNLEGISKSGSGFFELLLVKEDLSLIPL